MSDRIKVTLALMSILFAAFLFLGTAAPHSQALAHSPYVSALSNFGVAPAEAASHKCSNTGCLVLQGIYSCRGGEYPGTNCVIVNARCEVTTCTHP